MDAIEANADLSEPACVDSETLPWMDSGSKGVWRRILERDGGEVARATSVVRYDPGASFPRHVHGGGEEFLVLEGTFADDDGEYPRGTYVRNAVGSSHAPSCPQGCVIFVKLRQGHRGQPQVRVHPADRRWLSVAGGIERATLFADARREHVCLERLEPGAVIAPVAGFAGREVLVLEGSLDVEGRTCGRGTWLRKPPTTTVALHALTTSLVWIKRGHLGGGIGSFEAAVS